MNHSLKVGVFAFAIAALSVSAFAAPVTGVWHGRIKVDSSKLPKATTAAQQARMTQGVQEAASITMLLNLKPDHSFTESIKGKTVNTTITGTWTQTATAISLIGFMNGKKAEKPLTLSIAKDQKSLSFNSKFETFNFTR